jgi:hypothetical protein
LGGTKLESYWENWQRPFEKGVRNATSSRG